MFKLKVTASLLLALTISQTLPSWSLGLGRRQNVLGNFIAQPNEKLSEDGEPDTQAAATSKPLDLSPMSLDGATAQPQGEGSDGNYLKSSVSETDFIPKAQDAQTKNARLGTMSVSDEGKKGGLFRRRGLLKDAKDVNLMPVPLMVTDKEAVQKTDYAENAEQTQLADLWEAALARSQDIQFVIQKLMPSSDEGHTAQVMYKFLSTALYGAMGAAQFMVPTVGSQMGVGLGGSAIAQLLGTAQSKNAKKAQVSQTESIILYNMVRHTADDQVKYYRDYKKNMIALSRSLTDLSDLQAMVGDARSSQDAAKQIDMEYTLRKAQRDVDVVANDVKHHRQSLIDLAGPEAVAKLDKQLDEEQKTIEVASPGGDTQREKVM